MARIAQKRDAKAIVRQGSAAHSTSRAKEVALSKRLGSTLTPRSGAGSKKADAYIKGLVRIEQKGTTRASFSVTRGLLDKNDIAALSAGEIPVLVIQFMDEVGKIEDEQAVMRLYDLEALIKEVQEFRAQCQS